MVDSGSPKPWLRNRGGRGTPGPRRAAASRSGWLPVRVAGLILLSLAGAIGCSEPDGRDAPSATGSEGQPVTLTLTDDPLLTIGGHDERPDYQIVFNSGTLRLDGGHLVLADDATRELRFYDAQGRHLRTAGGEGSGPGEFRRLRYIARVGGDTVFAWDMLQRRISYFSADGSHLRTAELPALQQISGELQRRQPERFAGGVTVHPLQNGSLLVEPLLEPSMDLPEDTRVRQDTVFLYLIDPSGEEYVEIGSYPAGEWFFHERRGGSLPFGESLRIAAGSDAVYVGSTRNPTIQILSPSDARLIGSIDLPLQARSPTTEDIEQVRRRHVERVPAPLRALMTSYVEAIPWPATMPLYSDLRVAADDRLWVQRFLAPTDEHREWLILDPSGRRVESLSMDASLELLDAGPDYIVARARDEFDVEEIRIYGLTQTP